MKFKIGYFYSEDLNLYGDNGNVEVLVQRCLARGINVEVIEIGVRDLVTPNETGDLNFVFMGGGPDSSQKSMYEDLLQNKRSYLEDYIESGGVGLFICGSYQLLGQYYKAADGSILDGLGFVDFYTENFGLEKPRCIGNIVCEINPELRHDPIFNANNKIGSDLVGFENHGGRTYLGSTVSPFGKVLSGSGNNGEDNTEGILYKNIIGTYLHGPLLSKNPHIADYLIAKSLKIDRLINIDDDLINTAHTALKALK